jgi:hypothetical protein
MNIIWGGNHMQDCLALLTWQDQVVLAVKDSPLRVSLKTPQPGTATPQVVVEDNQVVDTNEQVRVVSNAQSIAVLLNGAPILLLQEIGESNLLLHSDLRPLGMNIYDDAAGLHIGGSVLAANHFSGCSTAISLG